MPMEGASTPSARGQPGNPRANGNAAMLIIESFGERHRRGWDDFVAGSPQGNFFHLTGWMDVVRRSFGHKPHCMLATENGQVRGVLPLFELKSRLFGHSLVSVPFGVYGGPCAADREARDALVSSAEILAEAMGVDYLELRNMSAPAASGEPDAAGNGGAGKGSGPRWVRNDLYVTFRKPILPDVEANMQAIPRKQRAMVRKGVKNGLSSRIGRLDALDAFYSIYSRNVRDLGTPVFPKRFFREILETFGDSFILLVLKGDAAVAGVLSFAFKGRLMPYYGAGLREHFKDAANDFMYWELLRHGCENGFTEFDFGRSKRGSGSHDFKCHWGFEPSPLDYRTRLVRSREEPKVNPTNPRYKLFIEGWKRLPLPLANLLGPCIVRNIP